MAWISGAGNFAHWPSLRATSGFRRRSRWITTTPSRVTPTSSSSVSTPMETASSKPGSVFSGAWPRAPRWPCRSIELTTCGTSAINSKTLLNLRTGFAHHALEHRRLGLDVRVERLGRSRRRGVHALQRDLVFHLLLGEAFERRFVQAAHDRRRRAGGYVKAEPEGVFVAWKSGGFGAGDAGYCRRGLALRDRERAHAPGAHEAHHRGRSGEH